MQDMAAGIRVKVEVLEQAIEALSDARSELQYYQKDALGHKRQGVADLRQELATAETALRAAVQGSGEGGKRP